MKHGPNHLVRWLKEVCFGSSQPTRGSVDSRTGRIKFHHTSTYLYCNPIDLPAVNRRKRNAKRRTNSVPVDAAG